MRAWSGRAVRHPAGFFSGVLVFGILSAAHATEPRDVQPFDHPAFFVSLLKGEMSRKGTPKEGMVNVKSPPADQVLYWSVASSSLRARAEHERGLMLRAADEGAEVSVSELVEADKPGRASLSWTAKVEQTHFKAVVVDCASHLVLLTTMGSSAAEIRRLHARSLKTLRCRAGK